MRCPYCSSENSQVKDSRPTEEGQSIRRRRECDVCKARFTTFERVQLREIVVTKRSGEKVPFEREKLARSLNLACRRRPVPPEQIERIVSSISRRLESMGEVEISSNLIGQLAMEALFTLDAVAYVRFASVYRDFREISDFQGVIGEITRAPAVVEEDPAPKPAAPVLPLRKR